MAEYVAGLCSGNERRRGERISLLPEILREPIKYAPAHVALGWCERRGTRSGDPRRAQMRIGRQGSSLVQTPKTLIQDLTPLNGNGSSAQVEEAIRCLGQYLGLRSTRPDKESGTGPDVLWIGNDGCAVCIEVKTNKQETVYRKADVGSCIIMSMGKGQP